MENRDRQKFAIDAYIAIEEYIARLYKVYADKYPEHREFWSALSEEEIGHAQLLRIFFKKVEEGLALFNERRFRVDAMKTLWDYISGLIADAKEQKMRPAAAFYMALDLENSLLEKDMYRVFEVDSIELKKVLQALHTSTGEHRDRIREKWLQVKSRDSAH
ncbi:MAG: hypothetical protein JW844_00625 [Candidatus Omnitrophica bacterium]|nr:hypothetical protein [Candidatus Omnitrophota bacterium]